VRSGHRDVRHVQLAPGGPDKGVGAPPVGVAVAVGVAVTVGGWQWQWVAVAVDVAVVGCGGDIVVYVGEKMEGIGPVLRELW
jgi:hypothetical protein